MSQSIVFFIDFLNFILIMTKDVWSLNKSWLFHQKFGENFPKKLHFLHIFVSEIIIYNQIDQQSSFLDDFVGRNQCTYLQWMFSHHPLQTFSLSLRSIILFSKFPVPNEINIFLTTLPKLLRWLHFMRPLKNHN